MRTCDAGGHIIGRIIRTYNAAGLLIEERPIVENPAPMFLDRIPTDGQDQPTEAQIEALTKGLKAFMSGRAATGTWHTYDAQDRIKTTREINFIFERTTEVMYNERGDRAVEHSTIAGNSVRPVGTTFSIEDDGTLVPSEPTPEGPTDPFDPPQRSEVGYTYQYDDRGNWTQQTANYGPNSGGPPNVRNRMLTYY